MSSSTGCANMDIKEFLGICDGTQISRAGLICTVWGRVDAIFEFVT